MEDSLGPELSVSEHKGQLRQKLGQLAIQGDD